MNTLERQVLRIIGEDPSAPDVFTDDTAGMAQIRDSLSEAAQEFAMLFGGYKQRVYVPLRANSTFYRLNLQDGYFAWVSDAWNLNRRRQMRQTDILQLRAHDARWLTYSGHPDRYFQLGLEAVGVVPKPSGDSEVAIFNVVSIPHIYEHEDARVRLRPEFEDAAVSYAVGEYFASRGDARTATPYLRRYLEVAKLRHRQNQSPADMRGLQGSKEPLPGRVEADGVR